MKAQNRLARRLTTAITVATCVVCVGCTSAPAPPRPSADTTAGRSATATTPAANTLTIDITIANQTVNPSGKKIDATVGQTVVLNVTSDSNDELHAHIGGDGYELEVPAGKPTTGSFVITDPGSFEIESHQLEKTIVILNAR